MILQIWFVVVRVYLATIFLYGVRSQLKPYAWLEMLTSGSGVDPDFHFLLDGVVNGFRVVNKETDIRGLEGCMVSNTQFSNFLLY